jgi:hypothetical protein
MLNGVMIEVSCNKFLRICIYSILLLLLGTGFSAWGQTTYTWVGPSGGAWTEPTNWNPKRTTPVNNDILQFTNNSTLTVIDVPTQTIGKLQVRGTNTNITLKPSNGGNRTLTINTASEDALTVESGSILTIIGCDAATDRTLTLTLTTADTNGLQANISGKLVVGIDNNQPNAAGIFTKGANATINFLSGSTYEHARNGGTIPTATWDATSNCNVTGITSTAPSGLNQTFGNFTWNCTGQGTSNLDIYSNGLPTIKGNFNVTSTGTTGSIRLARNSDLSFDISGNYTQSGGIVNLTRGSGNLTMNISGDFSMTGGTLSESSSGSGNITFNGSGTQAYSKTGGTISNTINFAVNSGSTLDVGTNVIDGSSGTFTLNSGAGIITANTDSNGALNTSGANGSIQVAGTRTFRTGANYTYNGASAQYTGNALTGANNLTINNSARVTLSNAATVAGTLALTNGILITTATNLLSVTNTSTSAISGGSTTAFISGPVKWSLALGSSYTFPVGKESTYLPFGLSVTSGASPQITVESFADNTGGSATSPLGSLSTTEYWLASISSGTYANGVVSLTRQSALDGLDAIGRSATLTGAYSNLNGTVSGTSINSSDATGNSLGYFVMASKRSIATGTISGSPFCAGSNVSVPYTISGTFNSGNVFTAQLSDASGSFSSPVSIGTLTSTSSGTITGTIPSGTSTGSGYRIRVVSNSPAVTGSDNGSNLTVNALPSAAGTIAGSSTVTQGQTGVAYSVPAIANATSYVWTYSGTGATINGTGNSITIDFSESATSGSLTVYGTQPVWRWYCFG